MPSIVTSVKGHTYTSSFEAKTKPDQVDGYMPILERESTPLFTEIQSVAGKEVHKDSTFYHHEVEAVPDTITVTATEAVAAGHIYAANDYVYIQQYDVLINTRTKHVIQIDDATITASELTCHTVGGTDLGVTTGDVYRRIGNAFSEGGTAPSPLMTVEELKTWYLQVIRRTTEVTRTQENVECTFGSRRAVENKKKLIQIKKEIELAGFLGGAGTSDTGGGPPVTNMTVPASAGMYHTITTNAELNQGTLTLGALQDICDAPRKYHPSGDFTIYAGPTVMGIISDLIQGKVNVENGATSYGINIKNLTLGPNKIRLVEQPLFDDEFTGRMAFVVPNPVPKFVRMGSMVGEPIMWFKDIKKDDNNRTIKDEIYGWFGYRFIEEKRFALIDGITG